MKNRIKKSILTILLVFSVFTISLGQTNKRSWSFYEISPESNTWGIETLSFWTELSARSSGLYFAPAVEAEAGTEHLTLNIRLGYARNLMYPKDDMLFFQPAFGYRFNIMHRVALYPAWMHGPFRPKTLGYMTPTALSWEINPFANSGPGDDTWQIELWVNYYHFGYYNFPKNNSTGMLVNVHEPGSRTQISIRLAKRLTITDAREFY